MINITINGRTLIEPQVQALFIAVSVLRQQILNPVEYGDLMCRFNEVPDLDEDRLAEVSQMLSAPVNERQAQERVLTEMHRQRVERVLQLAGIVPESAAPRARKLAEGYVLAGARNDEAAVRLRRALESDHVLGDE